MRSLGFVALSTLALVSLSGVARAQSKDFEKGTFAISMERLSGFNHVKSSTTVNTPGGDVTTSTSADRFMLMGMEASSPADLPRVGLDYFIIDKLSLGGTLFIGYSSATTNLGGLGNANASATDILFAPRVGYAVMFNDTIGVWPRGGFSYFHRSIDPDNGPSDSAYYLALNLEAPFIFGLANGFAITAGPAVDVSLTGSATTHNANVSVDRDISYFSFGLFAGFLAWF
ncbi:MAG TPA: hypothetical protein VHE30_05425 [Polyangiaceae bacterium]|nr:hypothetical protein [Polyangiaceae bacterium]